MGIDKIFKDGITKKQKNMTFTFLILGIIFTIWGLIKGLNTIDPKYFVLLASLVGLVISGFAIGGKLFQDLNSGKKQERILDTTILTLNKTRQALEKATDNFELSQKIDTTTTNITELSVLTNQNIHLIEEQNNKIGKYNVEIDKNINLVKKINELQTENLEEIKRNITGGDSYFSLFMFPDGNNLRLSGVIGGELEGSVGKYPIENLSFGVKRNGVQILGTDQKNYNINQDYTLGNFELPANENFVTFAFTIFSKNSNYIQFIIFKRLHSSHKWYYHLIQLYDIYGFKLRANTYEGNYPNELKNMYRQADFEILQIIEKINKK